MQLKHGIAFNLSGMHINEKLVEQRLNNVWKFLVPSFYY